MKDLSVKVFLKSIVVQEKQHASKKLEGDETFAAIESGSIYVLNGKWRVKGKKISNVIVEETTIVVTTDDSTFTFQKLSKRDHDSSKWELFCNQCTKMAKKNKSSEQETMTIPKIKNAISKGQSYTGGNIFRNSNDITSSKSSLRRRGKFGKTGKNINSDIISMPWDDGIDEENVYSTIDSDSLNTSSEVGAELFEVTDRATPTLEEETSKPKMEPFYTVAQQTDAIVAQMSPKASIDVGHIKGRRKLSKLSAANGKPDESDTDDDGIFNETADGAEMTTPIAQRIVSPAGTLSTEQATHSIGSDDSLPDKCNAEAKSKKIDSFFRPRKNKCAETPPPNKLPTGTAFNATQSLSSLYSHSNTQNTFVLETVTESAKRRKSSLQENDDWLRRSPGLKSSTGNRVNIFGKHHDSSALSPKYETISKMGNISDDSNTFISNAESVPRTSRLKRPRLKELHSTIASHDMDPSAHSPSLPTSPSSAIVLTPTRADFHFRGLRNLGNTCYLNASLQMLFSCFGMINSLRRYHGLLTSSLLAVADGLSMNTGKWNSVNPSIVKEAMDKMTDKFYGYEQRDSHEFLNDLIDHLHEELEVEASPMDKVDNCDVTSKSDDMVIPTNDFCLTVRVMLKCTSCKYCRYVADRFYSYEKLEAFANSFFFICKDLRRKCIEIFPSIS